MKRSETYGFILIVVVVTKLMTLGTLATNIVATNEVVTNVGASKSTLKNQQEHNAEK